MMHKAIVRMDPTKLEMLAGFEQTDAGHKFTPEDSNVRIIISGRDWSEKRILIYGSTSTEEAQAHVETIIDRVAEVDHDAELINGPEITNIAVSGDSGTSLQLETVAVTFHEQGIDVEYEPEQFPAVIVKLEELEVTFLLFSTGKFSIQGLITLDNIEKSINHILKYLGKSQYD